MKARTKTLLAALMLLAISCKKESTAIQTLGNIVESATQGLSSEVSELNANAVRIGNAVVMVKNLSVSHYRNGDPIPQVKDPAKWAKLTIGAWCWYNNDSATGHIYGRLYNWYAVNDPRGLAPAGWHIPSDAEWTKLSNYLGGETVAGGKMKSTGTIEDGTGLWLAPNYGATNSSGFTGLPGGFRFRDGSFGGLSFYLGYVGYWWSSTEFNTYGAWSRYLYYSHGDVSRGLGDKPDGFSVRCVKD